MIIADKLEVEIRRGEPDKLGWIDEVKDCRKI